MRSWTAPPTRREVTLLLFSLTIFVLSYNLETSLGLVGVRPQKLSSTYLSSIGLGTKDPGFDADGRRPKQWRDELEDMIVGDWEWREGEVAGSARSQSAPRGTGRYGLVYNFESGRKARRSAEKGDRGVSLSTGVTVKDQFVKWGKEVPQTSVVAHTPGFTILENVVCVNGTLFVVANDWEKVPKLGDIASSSVDPSRPPRVQDWHILTTSDASEWFGPYAAKIHGTSWLALDVADDQDPYLLLSLFRTHASLMSSGPSSSFTTPGGLHIISPSTPSRPASSVPAPLRLIFPHIPTFSTPNVPPPVGQDKAHPPPRERAYFGIHPLLPKAVLPTVGMWFEEDWKDLADMHVPFLLERVVIADRGAAERGRANWRSAAPSSPESQSGAPAMSKRAPGEEGEPAWAAPFVGLNAPDGWWAPMRSALLRFLHIADMSLHKPSSHGGGFWGKSKQVRKPVVSYVSMQGQPAVAGPRLSVEDHQRLVSGLQKLEQDGLLGEVHVLSGNGSVSATEWEERMSAIARSTIVMGPYGDHLADGIFMRSPSADGSPAVSPAGEKEQPGPRSLPPMLMEFFPPGTFVRDQEYAMQALGIDYMAWWKEMKFAGSNLPSVSVPSPSAWNTPIPLDVEAVLRVVREEAPRRVV
ncbi:hypothetical protein K466DRAFT_555640 [Polyporus arcularius HHB13444]|uniref:Uncharacterized protein n=1 Tax=Polyporus arcularius HHB13444 TaxID=1314778 RepID=A0A5C3P057_9APHY|nr:hypothetical protein K466DRAFT_555640 [Polyporus arcularius HHB13444]